MKGLLKRDRFDIRVKKTVATNVYIGYIKDDITGVLDVLSEDILLYDNNNVMVVDVTWFNNDGRKELKLILVPLKKDAKLDTSKKEAVVLGRM